MKFLKSNLFKILLSIFIYTISSISYSQMKNNNNEYISTSNMDSTKKHIVIIGPPASGKGTHGGFISKTFNIPKISTGDILRAEVAAKTEIGKKVQYIMETGGLVDDDTIIALLKQRLEKKDAKNGFILDGFPRTTNQAQALNELNVNINYVIELKVADEVAISRISGRRIHPASGRSYHVITNPPKKEGLDDITQEPLITRDDDKPESIKKRLKIYYEQTAPVTKWYKKLASEGKLKYIEIRSDQQKGIPALNEEILKKLKE